jgi:phage terminase small subunit
MPNASTATAVARARHKPRVRSDLHRHRPGAKLPRSRPELGGNALPRRSSASLTVAAFAPDRRRLEPPPELGGLEAEIFRQTVASVPASHFQPEDLVLLCAYARAAAMGQRAAEEVAARPTIGDRPSPFVDIHSQAIRSLTQLTVRLRLGPRSRDPNHQRTAKVKASQSYYDQIGGQR